jgi:hypothetical protein
VYPFYRMRSNYWQVLIVILVLHRSCVQSALVTNCTGMGLYCKNGGKFDTALGDCDPSKSHEPICNDVSWYHNPTVRCACPRGYGGNECDQDTFQKCPYHPGSGRTPFFDATYLNQQVNSKRAGQHSCAHTHIHPCTRSLLQSARLLTTRKATFLVCAITDSNSKLTRKTSSLSPSLSFFLCAVLT